MKVIRLEAENIKKLVAIDITPEGNIVEVTGPNGAGKTSILDAIWWALAGGGPIQSKPIRKGEEKARIRLDLGDLVVTRRFNAQEDGGFTTSVTVEKADGARYPSPQAMLDALVGSLSFDPLDFTRMSAKSQLDELKRVTGLDFTDLENANAEDYRTRTAVNRRVKELRTQAGSIVVPNPADVPDELLNEAGLMQRIADASNENRDIEKRRYNRDRAVERIDAISEEIDQLVLERHELQTRLDEAPPLPELIDTAALAAELTQMRADNLLIARKRQRTSLMEQAVVEETKALDLTKAMEARELTKRRLIEDAEMPVEGLGFGDGYITLSGAPFDQASDAEQLRASVAIAAAMNPKLKVIRVRDGSLLDDDSMALLAAYAQEHDLQVWIETVKSDRAGAIRIEDGQVVAKPRRSPKRDAEHGEEHLL